MKKWSIYSISLRAPILNKSLTKWRNSVRKPGMNLIPYSSPLKINLHIGFSILASLIGRDWQVIWNQGMNNWESKMGSITISLRNAHFMDTCKVNMRTRDWRKVLRRSFMITYWINLNAEAKLLHYSLICRTHSCRIIWMWIKLIYPA